MGYIKPIHDVLGLEHRVVVNLKSSGQSASKLTTINNAKFVSKDGEYTLYRKPSKDASQFWCTLKINNDTTVVDDTLGRDTAVAEGEILCKVTVKYIANKHNALDIFSSDKSYAMYGDAVVSFECPDAPDIIRFTAKTNAKTIGGKSFRGVRNLVKENCVTDTSISMPILSLTGEEVPDAPPAEVLPSGRKIYRHPNNQGSVLEFDYWGRVMKLFVADAKYRSATTLAYDTTRQDHGLPKMNDKSSWYPHGAADDRSNPLTWTMTDKEWQDKWPKLREDGTAKSNTDRLMQFSTTQAAHHCRNQNIPGIGTLDLPNIYELFIMYMEADKIDEMDPTFEQYKDRGLGCKSTYGRFDYMDSDVVWSSSEYSSDYARNVYYHGLVNDNYQNLQDGVAPVKELDA